MFRISPEKHECRDAASQTLPVEGLFAGHNLQGGGSSGSIGGRSTSTRGTSTTVQTVQNRQPKQYDYRRMTESLWSPPPVIPSAGPGTNTTVLSRDGGHLWGTSNVQRQPSTRTVSRGGSTAEMVATNEGRTMSSVGILTI